MDTEETNTMLKDIYGKYYATSDHGKKLNKKIQRLGKNGLARQQFEEFAADNEELLEVPNKYLKQICARTLGPERWEKLTETRQKMNQNEFMDLYDFLTILNSKTGSNIEFVTLAEHTESVSHLQFYDDALYVLWLYHSSFFLVPTTSIKINWCSQVKKNEYLKKLETAKKKAEEKQAKKDAKR